MELGQEVKKNIAVIPPRGWCVHANVVVMPLYGWMTSNFVESEFCTQLQKAVRKLHSFAFINSMCDSLIDSCYVRS